MGLGWQKAWLVSPTAFHGIHRPPFLFINVINVILLLNTTYVLLPSNAGLMLTGCCIQYANRQCRCHAGTRPYATVASRPSNRYNVVVSANRMMPRADAANKCLSKWSECPCPPC